MNSPAFKRAIVLTLIISLVLTLFTACGGGTKASKKAISVAENAIQVVDDYLDGKITATAANDKLKELKKEMEYVDTLTSDDKNKASDFSISTSLTTLSSSILSDSYKSSDDTYDKIVDGRNSLAKKAGLKER